MGSRLQRWLQKIPQYTRTQRHVRALIRHGTLRKWLNLARAEWERRRRRITVRSRPYLLILDPCNVCDLRCPLCPTGRGELGRRQQVLSRNDFQRYFDPLAPFLFEVYLHNWGESLLNKNLFDMVRYAQSRNVGTNLSTNLVSAASEQLDAMLDSGLEYLIVSLDGTTQDVYAQYRVRGDWERAAGNLRELIRRRNARGLRRPFVEWQFIVMKHNQHQTDEAQRLARQWQVDLLRFIPVGIPFELRKRADLIAEWFPERGADGGASERSGLLRKPGPCFYLYRSMVVNPDGGVSPCCEVYRAERDFASLNETPSDIAAIWNNAKYRTARSLFTAQSPADAEPVVCEICDIFEGNRCTTAQRPRT